MAQAQLLRNVEVVADGQDTAGSTDAMIADNHGTIVKRRVLKENILNQALADVGIHDFSRGYDVSQRCCTLNDNEGAHLSLRHLHTGHHDGHDVTFQLLAVLVFARLGRKELQPTMHALMSSQVVEELAYLFLEQHDDGDYTHRYQLVEDGAQQFHLKYLRHQQPYDNKDIDAYKDIERARGTHQPVDIVEQQAYQQDVDSIFYAKSEEHIMR